MPDFVDNNEADNKKADSDSLLAPKEYKKKELLLEEAKVSLDYLKQVPKDLDEI